MSAQEFSNESRVTGQELLADNQVCGHEFSFRPKSFLIEKEFAAGLDLQARNPRFDRPRAIELFFLKEGELVRVGDRQKIQSAAAIARFVFFFGEPDTGGDVLSISQLGSGDGFTVEIAIGINLRVTADYQTRTAAGRAGNDHELFSFGCDKAIHSRTWSDKAHINGVDENGLDAGRSGVKGSPGNGRPGLLLELACGSGVKGLGMSDVREKTDSNIFRLGRKGGRRKMEESNPNR